jgi:hypothetical protein
VAEVLALDRFLIREVLYALVLSHFLNELL